MPFHGTTSCGSFQRKSPTGGAANGTPAKISTKPSSLSTPIIAPPVTYTASVCNGFFDATGLTKSFVEEHDASENATTNSNARNAAEITDFLKTRIMP